MSATRESVNISREQLLGMIDHSLLKPQLTRDEIVAGLEYAAEVRPKAICIVPNHLKLAGGEYDVVLADITEVVQAVAPAEVKVILETAYLTDEQILKGSALVSEA